ncbi:hypothetical protein T439DRAFT_382069 [Meredithblackwellia eburnea MCA 4105]
MSANLQPQFEPMRQPQPSTSTSRNGGSAGAAAGPSAQGGDEREAEARAPRAKANRVRVACQRCHRRKIRCSGTWPCAGCVAKGGVDCVFLEVTRPSIAVPDTNGGLQEEHRTKRPRESESASPAATSLSSSSRDAPPILEQDPGSAGSSGTGARPAAANHHSPTNAIPLPDVRNRSSSTSTNASAGIAAANAPPVTFVPDPPPRQQPDQPSGQVIARQPYFRWLGPTAIAPGAPFRELNVLLLKKSSQPKKSHASTSNHVPTHDLSAIDWAAVAQGGRNNRDPILSAIDSRASTRPGSPSFPNTPSNPTLPPLETVDIFYAHMSSYLPFLDKADFDAGLEQGSISEILRNAIGALAERIQPTEGSPHLADLYAMRAQHLLLPHLALPTVELVFALLLLAYNEFAADRDSGLWIWEGMAIRMSYDLGLHVPFQGPEPLTPEMKSHIELRTRTFWSVLCLDRFISSGTGRPTTIPLAQIKVGFPQRVIKTPSGQHLPDPFPPLCRLLLLLGKVTDVLNAHEEGMSDAQGLQRALAPLRLELNDFHLSLAPPLLFNVHNFQAYAAAQAAEVFLLLSSWYQGVYLSIHHSALLFSSSYENTNTVSEVLSRSSAISIGDMIAFADLIQPRSFLASPFLSQPLLLAGKASLALLRADPNASPTTQNGIALYRAFQLCRSALLRQQGVWKGVAWLCTALETLMEDFPWLRESSDPGTSPTPTTVSIQPRDRGLIKRARLEDEARSKVSFSKESAAAVTGDPFAGGMGFSISGIENEGDSGLLELFQPGTDMAPVSWGTRDYSFEPIDPNVPVGQNEMNSYFRSLFESGLSVDNAYEWLVPN